MLRQLQLVPPDLLRRAERILFIAHLAIGDFTYLQNCFRAFSRAYPHIKIDLFVDELRRTGDASEWPSLKNYALYDWLEACPYFSKVYRQTYSPPLFERSVAEAQQQAYPIVISLAVLRRHEYARLARRISSAGFVVGQKKRWFPDITKYMAYRQLDASIPAYSPLSVGRHICDIYAEWFELMFGLQILPEERFPFVAIPSRWECYARDQFDRWGLTANAHISDESAKVIFVNAFSKAHARDWPMERVIELIRCIRQLHGYAEACFIVNVVPEKLTSVQELFRAAGLEKVHLFWAEENFFQLPAILHLCDLIVSVETSVVHLANAVHVPVIALMRQKNPEWEPVDTNHSHVVTVRKRKDWVKEITVQDVISAIQSGF